MSARSKDKGQGKAKPALVPITAKLAVVPTDIASITPHPSNKLLEEVTFKQHRFKEKTSSVEQAKDPKSGKQWYICVNCGQETLNPEDPQENQAISKEALDVTRCTITRPKKQ